MEQTLFYLVILQNEQIYKILLSMDYFSYDMKHLLGIEPIIPSGFTAQNAVR